MKINEKNFIRRLQRQKEDALEFIVDQYSPLIKGITYKVLAPLKNEGIIDECMNDVLLAIWNNAKKFHGDSTDFRKWISVIAKYKALDYYRKVTKTVEFSSDYIDVNAEISAEDELIIMEDQAEIIRLINHLEPIDRDIFIMKFFLGFTTEEISIKLSLTKAAIDNRVYRGKMKLFKKATSLNLGGSVV